MKKSKLFKGALIISLGGFITKVIGALYRIPLTSILGAYGLGLYQMAFPFYCLLLTISSTGVPNGIAKLIASGEDANSVLKSALKLFLPLSILAFLVMAVFSKNIATFQGNEFANGNYLALAPSLIFVSCISCFRGYFQGLSKMSPTAISQIIEQFFKAVFGLTLCLIFSYNKILASIMATLSVSISEFIALIYFIIIYKKHGNFLQLKNSKTNVKKVLLIVVPITFTSIVIPLVRTVESFMIVNILKEYLQNATSLYGLYSGGVESIISVPVAICYGVAVALIPEVAKTKDYKSKSKKVLESVILTILQGVIFALLLVLFSSLAVKILYPSLLESEKVIMIKMLKLSSLSVIFLPLMQTSVAILVSLSKTSFAVKSGIVSGVIKLILSYFLLKMPSFNIFATIFTDIISYFVACFLNLMYIVIVLKKFKRQKYE